MNTFLFKLLYYLDHIAGVPAKPVELGTENLIIFLSTCSKL